MFNKRITLHLSMFDTLVFFAVFVGGMLFTSWVAHEHGLLIGKLNEMKFQESLHQIGS